MKRALREYQVTGVKTSIGFLKRIMENDDNEETLEFKTADDYKAWKELED